MKREDVKLTQDQANRAVALMQTDPAEASDYIESCRRLSRLVGKGGILDSVPSDDLKPALVEYVNRRWPAEVYGIIAKRDKEEQPKKEQA